jgi:anti-anti-sigma factor
MSVQYEDLAGGVRAQPVLDFLVAREADVLIVGLRGELDADGGLLLTEFVDQIVVAEAPRVLVLDLAGVEFICAAGIRALLLARGVVTAGGGELVLRSVPRLVGRALAATGDLACFPVVGSPAGAS